MYLKLNGKRIRELRKKRGWTQEELGSKEMNAKGLKQISTRTIQKIENDHTFLCSKKMIKNIANVLVIDVNELIINKTEVILSNTMQDTIDKSNGGKHEHVNFLTKSDQKNIWFPQGNEEMEEGDDLSEEQLNRIFTVDEAMIRASDDVYTDADHEAIWDFNDKLREFKFIPTSYYDLANGIGETPSAKKFQNLVKMEKLSNPYSYEYKSYPLSDSKEILSGNKNSFFEHLSKSNQYYIESFIPKDESSTELILKIIQNIDKYFEAEASFSEEFKIKSTLASLIEQLENKKIGLFFNMSISRSEQFDAVHGYMRCWETNYIKIIIKEWSSVSVRTKEVLHDKKNRISLSTYKEGWREITEVDPIYPDDQETDDPERIPF